MPADLQTSNAPFGLARGGVVHVVDHDALFRRRARGVLKEIGVGAETYPCAEHFVATYRARPVECMLVELCMPRMSGLDLQREVLKRNRRARMIMATTAGDTADVVRAIKRGACDFLSKPVDDAQLVSAVRGALAESARMHSSQARRDAALSTLTSREREVLDGFVTAKTTRQIAGFLGISPKTVEKHRASIFEKTGAGSVPELMRLVLCADDPASHSPAASTAL